MKLSETTKGTIRGRLPDGAANPIDLHVGKKLKEARLARGYSQEYLAKEMGITFQQVQKYEKGLNRIGASRLWDLAQVLRKPISYFYEGMTEFEESQSPRNITVLRDSNGEFSIDNLKLTPDDLELLTYFKNIRDPEVAQTILTLVRSLATNRGYIPPPPVDFDLE